MANLTGVAMELAWREKEKENEWMCSKSIDPIDLKRMRPLYEITATKRFQSNHNYERQNSSLFLFAPNGNN